MMTTMNYFAAQCHADNMKWWLDLETGKKLDRNKGQLLMLVISELAEAMEGERKGLMDDKLPHRKMAEVELVDALIRILDYAGAFGYDLDAVTLHDLDVNLYVDKGEHLLHLCNLVQKIYAARGNVELSTQCVVEFIANVHQYAGKYGYDLPGAYEEKRAFNAVRVDHTAEHRKAAGGKKW